MDRNQAKEFYPILQAFAEGKAIECRTRTWELNKGWQYSTTWKETEELKFQDTYEYRIKPEPKYRPFKDAKECLQEMQKHQPFGWIKCKEGYFSVVYVNDEYAGLGDKYCSSILLASKNSYTDNTFVDGTPFGMKVEE